MKALVPFLLAMSLPALAGLVIPAGFELRKVHEQGGYSYFKGRLTLEGTLYAGWKENGDDPTGASDLLLVVVVPEPKTLAGLPYYKDYPLDHVTLEKPKDALKQIFPADQVESFLARKRRTLKAAGIFQVVNYKVGVECDSPFAFARLVRPLHAPRVLQAAAGEFDTSGC